MPYAASCVFLKRGTQNSDLGRDSQTYGRRYGATIGVVVTSVIAVEPAIVRAAEPTRVVKVSPRDKAEDVDLESLVQIHFSNGLKLQTLTAESVRLLGTEGKPVATKLGSDIEGDVVNIQPRDMLLPQRKYTLEVGSKLIDKLGSPVTPFRSTFTTGTNLPRPAPKEGFRFGKLKVEDVHGPTAIAIGPDKNVYVATYEGLIFRVKIHPATGLSTGQEKLLSL